MRAGVVAAILLLSACGNDAPTAAAPPASAPTPVAMPEAPPLDDGATLHMKAIDLHGTPVAGMVPIVTRNANATDYPIANGEPTAADGTTTLTVPVAEHVYVRMWDPTFGRFANNYFDVEVGRNVPGDVLEVVMVPGASLTATLLTAAGTPAANENVGLMMFHPAKGPWWPAESTTDEHGAVHFPHVPAGKYTIRIKALESGAIGLNDVMLHPDARVDLGTLTLSGS